MEATAPLATLSPFLPALATVAADPQVIKRFEELGITPLKLSSGQFADYVARQISDWAPALKAADMKP